MKDEINELIHNMIIDLRKKDMNKNAKAKLIEAYMNDNKLSLRGLSKETGVPHTTLQGWINYKKITPEHISKLEEAGYSSSEVTNLLKSKKSNLNEEDTVLDLKLKKIIQELQPFLSKPVYSKRTSGLLLEAKNIINRIDMKIEADQK